MGSRQIIFLEPWDDGSHRAFREGLLACSRHRYTTLTLPGRFWKWRMRAAAAWFADRLNEQRPAADVILTTGFLNVADLRGLLRPPLDRLPVVLYMHENQLTYPLSPLEEFDFHFGFTNIISCLAADRVVFNSDWHRDLFLEAIPAFLNRMPEAIPRDVPARIRARCEVVPVGLERSPLPAGHFPQYRGGRCEPEAGPPWPRGDRHLLLWNHRWEFDKRPEMFARALAGLLDRGLDFEVALLGDPAGQEAVFAPVAERLGPRCRAFAGCPNAAPTRPGWRRPTSWSVARHRSTSASRWPRPSTPGPTQCCRARRSTRHCTDPPAAVVTSMTIRRDSRNCSPHWWAVTRAGTSAGWTRWRTRARGPAWARASMTCWGPAKRWMGPEGPRSGASAA